MLIFLLVVNSEKKDQSSESSLFLRPLSLASCLLVLGEGLELGLVHGLVHHAHVLLLLFLARFVVIRFARAIVHEVLVFLRLLIIHVGVNLG